MSQRRNELGRRQKRTREIKLCGFVLYFISCDFNKVVNFYKKKYAIFYFLQYVLYVYSTNLNVVQKSDGECSGFCGELRLYGAR
jgi:hypothetical protein